VNRAFESASEVAATMSMLFANTITLLPLLAIIDDVQAATLHAQKTE
jgi:hypothetical protein